MLRLTLLPKSHDDNVDVELRPATKPKKARAYEVDLARALLIPKKYEDAEVWTFFSRTFVSNKKGIRINALA